MIRKRILTSMIPLLAVFLTASCAEIAYLQEPAEVADVRLRAEDGDPESRYRMGLMYSNGQQVPQDYAVAREWFYLAAQQGHSGAQYMIGIGLTAGRGLPQDREEAVSWYQMAAEQGHAHAQYQLADAYLNGRGVDKEPAWAALWLGKAAEAGHAEAQFAFGVARATGIGLPKDRVEAWKWLALAQKHGHDEAARVRARVAQEMTKAQRNHARMLAINWKARKTATFADPPTIRFVQYALKKLGFDAGQVDGRAGPATRAAVEAYCQSRGIQAGPGVSVEVVEALRSDFPA